MHGDDNTRPMIAGDAGRRGCALSTADANCSGIVGRYNTIVAKRYTVSDGKLVLTLEVAEEGGYAVTSPLDPQLITEAESVTEAFANARDALKALARSRAKLLKRTSAATPDR